MGLAFIVLLSLSGEVHAQRIESLLNIPGDSWRETRPLTERLVRHSGRVKTITIHYTGMPQNPQNDLRKKLRGLTNYSIANPKGPQWGDMPYHYYIDMDGKAGKGRDEAYRPDTNTGYNTDGHITIVVEGDNNDPLHDVQRVKLMAMIKSLEQKHGLRPQDVGIHKHYHPPGKTSCPGDHITQLINDYRRAPPVPLLTTGTPRPAPLIPSVRPNTQQPSGSSSGFLTLDDLATK